MLLVELVFGGEGLLKGNGEGSDGVIMGTALVTREDASGAGFVSSSEVWWRRIVNRQKFLPEINWSLQVVQGLLALLINASNTLPEEDHCTTGPTKGLVGSSGDDICV